MQTFYKSVLRALCILTLLTCGNVGAQTIYGVGAINNALDANNLFINLFNRFYVVDPITGVASVPAVPNSLPAGVTESVAIAVSPINGLVYWVERTVVTPRIGTWNPSTGATTIIGNAGTPGTVAQFLRATFCPNGRFYIAGNGAAGAAGAEVYEINPTTLALVRTVVLTNVPTNGSGDIVCTTNGDMYVIAQQLAANGGLYQLFRVTQAQLAVAGNLSIATNLQASLSTPNTQAFNGLSEAPNGSLIASVATQVTATYSINTTTAVATTLTTAPAAALGDLSREFPRDISIAKSVTPTTALQGNSNVIYTLIVRNPGPAVAANIVVIDLLPLAGVNAASANWACSITAPGAVTAVTSACATPTGTGAVNTTVSLSIGGTAQIVITVPALSTFTGTLTNTATASVTANTLDTSSVNNIATITSVINPATNLNVTKTDGIVNVVAGSTNSYTVTFTNSGPGDGAGSVIKDTTSSGLSNCTVTGCTGTGAPTPAVCPAPLNNLLTPSGVTVATFPANSSLTYTVLCGVTATGQ
jgi:uncharacterized repeat protein (TIGR01451 family)